MVGKMEICLEKGQYYVREHRLGNFVFGFYQHLRNGSTDAIEPIPPVGDFALAGPLSSHIDRLVPLRHISMYRCVTLGLDIMQGRVYPLLMFEAYTGYQTQRYIGE